MNDNLVLAMSQLLNQRYDQVVEVNFSVSRCSIVWAKKCEDMQFFILDRIWHTTELYAKDIKLIEQLHNIAFIQEQLSLHESLSYRFRLNKLDLTTEWMQVEVVKTQSYSDTNVDVYMFIKSIQDSYAEEYNAKKEAEHLALTDSLTGYLNRLAFEKFCENTQNFDSVGVVYIDLNSLKKINDTEGHDVGDKYIRSCCTLIDCYLGEYNIYRIGGDEFVVIALDCSRSRFESKLTLLDEAMNRYRSSNWLPMFSFGYVYATSNEAPIKTLVRVAEKLMYDRKSQDYEKSNVNRRRY